jgi:hypothetical protein
MKFFHAQSRPQPETEYVGPSSFKLRTMALALSCTFFTFGCADRRSTVKNPESVPPPVTTTPVLAPAATTTATERLADDGAPARESVDAPGTRLDNEDVSPAPAGRDAGMMQQSVAATDAAHPQPPSSAAENEEEDVSAALRREVAEMERQRARQQPREWYR